MVDLDIFFLAFISGASMNHARSLAPALLSGVLGNLWVYCSATFIGSPAVAFVVHRKFKMPRRNGNGESLHMMTLVLHFSPPAATFLPCAVGTFAG
jgi:hypothetical protein